jgi:hypothetical protein
MRRAYSSGSSAVSDQKALVSGSGSAMFRILGDPDRFLAISSGFVIILISWLSRLTNQRTALWVQ